MSRTTVGASLALLLVTIAAAGCCPPPSSATRRRRTATRRAPPALRPASDIPFDFAWRQHVTAHWGAGRSAGFEAVLQKRGGRLLLVGLSPMGTRGFVLELRADGTTRFENNSGRRLPFEPSYMLADVQRAFFPWLAPVAGDFSGRRRGARGQLVIEETYRAGKLQARTFHRVGAPERTTTRVVYRGWKAGHDAPRRVELSQLRFGYRLVIETLTQQRLR